MKKTASYLRRKWEFFVIPAVFLLFTAIYLYPLMQGLILLPLDLLISNYAPWYNPGTILLKNPYMQDSITQLFPWRHLVFTSFQHGIIPLWNPYQFLGAPFMAGLKPMVFYPLNTLFILGEAASWNVLLFFQILLGGIFTYICCRQFSLRILPSVLVGISFTLSSLMMGLLQFGSDGHAIIWWPLFLFCAKRFLDTRKNYPLIILPIVIACSIFAGQLQYTTYGSILLFAFAIWYGRIAKVPFSSLLTIGISILLGIGLSSIQLVPSIEAFGLSHRALLDASQAQNVFSRGLLSPQQLLRLLAPDFFGNPVTRDATIGYIEQSGYFGIIPLFFCLYAVIFARKNRIVVFLSVVFILALLLSINPLGLILYYLKIPVLVSGSAERIFSLVLFSGSILAGIGLSDSSKLKYTRRLVISAVSFVLFYSGVIAVTILLMRRDGFSEAFVRNIRFPSLILVAFFALTLLYCFISSKVKSSRAQQVFMMGVIVLTFLDLFRMGYHFLTFSNTKFLYPPQPVTEFVRSNTSETLGRSFGVADPELETYLQIYSLETYNPLYLSRTAELLQVLQGKSNEKLSNDNKYLITSDKKYLKRTLDFLGTEYIVVGRDENPVVKYLHDTAYEKDLTLVYKDDRSAVFRNTSSYPRFSLFFKEIQMTDDKILKALVDDSFDSRTTLLLEDNVPAKITPGSGSARLLSSTVNSQTFSVSSSKPALFYISDTDLPGWSAIVNGKKVKIYRANYNFRAVLVPAGSSTVEFSYFPMSFILGFIVSTLCLLFLIPFWRLTKDFRG